MKILSLCQSYYPSRGGNQTQLKALAERFVLAGDEVTVLTSRTNSNEFFYRPQEDNTLAQQENIGGVDVRRFDIDLGMYNLIYRRLNGLPGGYRLGRWIMKDAYRLGKNGPFCPAMYRHALAEEADIYLVVNSANLHSYYGYQASRRNRKPLVVMPCMHEHEDWSELPVVYTILKDADMVIALTGHEKDFLVSKGVSEGRIFIGAMATDCTEHISAGMNIREKYGLNDAPVVVFVGRIIEGKGPGRLIDAMHHVWTQLPDTRLILAGSRTEYTTVIEEKLSGVDREKVIIIDNFTDEEKHGIYEAADVFAMPSTVDSFGIVYLEAWAHKKPVLALEGTPQSSFIVHGHDGVLAGPDNSDLAGKLTGLLSDKDKAAAMGMNGYRKVSQRYSWDVVVDELQDQFKGLIAGAGR